MFRITNEQAISIVRTVQNYLRNRVGIVPSSELNEHGDDSNSSPNPRKMDVWIYNGGLEYRIIVGVAASQLILHVYGTVDTREETQERKQYVGHFIQSMGLPWFISHSDRVLYQLIDKTMGLEFPSGSGLLKDDYLGDVTELLTQAIISNKKIHENIMTHIAPNEVVNKSDEQRLKNQEYISPSLHYAKVVDIGIPVLATSKGYVSYPRLGAADKTEIQNALTKLRAILMSQNRQSSFKVIAETVEYLAKNINRSDDLYVSIVLGPDTKPNLHVVHMFVTDKMDRIVSDVLGADTAKFDGVWYTNTSFDSTLRGLKLPAYTFGLNDILMDSFAETAAPYGEDRYEWRKYNSAKGLTIKSAKGKELKLKVGSVFGLRPASSKKGVFRLITKEHGKNIIFSLSNADAIMLTKRSVVTKQPK